MIKNIIKENNYMKKEYTVLIISTILLIVMIIGLLYLLFFEKELEVIVPDLPDNKEVDVGIIDYSKNNIDKNEIESGTKTNLDITNRILSDYYKKGIILTDTRVNYMDSNIIITSGYSPNVAFISSATLDGKINWITKIEDKRYENISINKTFFANDNFYISATAKSGGIDSLILITVTKNGEFKNISLIKADLDGQLKDTFLIGNQITLVTNVTNYQVVYICKLDGKIVREISTNSILPSSPTSTYFVSYQKENNINLIVKKDNKNYIIHIDSNNGKGSFEEWEMPSNLNGVSTLATGNDTGLVLADKKNIYKFDNSLKLINKYDYSNLKTEKITKELYDKYFKSDDETEEFDFKEYTNEFYIEGVSIFDNNIIMKGFTAITDIYDIYDLNLNLKKRIKIDTYKYEYIDGVLVKSFYINDSLYEFYIYGSETPSILIRKIG